MSAFTANKWEAAQCIGYSTHGLKSLRLSGELIEGIHYVNVTSRTIRYDLEALKIWLDYRYVPEAYEAAIERLEKEKQEFLKSLGKPPSKSRKEVA